MSFCDNIIHSVEWEQWYNCWNLLDPLIPKCCRIFCICSLTFVFVISSMTVLQELVEVFSKGSNVTAALCCIRLTIFPLEVKKIIFFCSCT